jgi:hypothetical protein
MKTPSSDGVTLYAFSDMVNAEIETGYSGVVPRLLFCCVRKEYGGGAT